MAHTCTDLINGIGFFSDVPFLETASAFWFLTVDWISLLVERLVSSAWFLLVCEREIASPSSLSKVARLIKKRAAIEGHMQFWGGQTFCVANPASLYYVRFKEYFGIV